MAGPKKRQKLMAKRSVFPINQFPRDPCRNILELPPRNGSNADVEKGCASFGVFYLFIVA